MEESSDKPKSENPVEEHKDEKSKEEPKKEEKKLEAEKEKVTKNAFNMIEKIRETIKSSFIPKIEPPSLPHFDFKDFKTPEQQRFEIEQELEEERHLEIKKILENQLDNLEKGIKNEMKKGKWSLIISIIAIIISFIGSLYGIYLAYTLNEPYLIPRDATLNRIWMTENNFGKWQFEYVGDMVTEAEICFYNEGRAPTGSISANWDYNLSWLTPSFLYIQNILGGTANCTRIPMIANYIICEELEPGERQLKCNKSLIPNGTQKITLNIDCKFCTPSKFNKTMTVCIFDNEVPSNYPCK